MIKITIGILAWNEAASILATLESLFAQTLFDKLDIWDAQVDVICVPNGSTDGTTAVAEAYLSSKNLKHVRCRVHTLAEAGKANAWNVLVHEVADGSTDFFLFLDADIIIDNPRTVINVLNGLLMSKEQIVTTDQPMKDIPTSMAHTIVGRSLSAWSMVTKSASGQLCGQLYCMRGSSARQTWLPKHLIIEDGLIKELVVTSFFTQRPDDRKIECVADASHRFSAYVDLKDLFRQQVRQAVGQAVNYMLIQWLCKRIDVAERPSAIGPFIRDLNERDPFWLIEMVKESCKGRFWVLYPGALTFRFARLKTLPWGQRLRLLPLALAGFCFDLPVLLVANWRLLHLSSLQELWSKKVG